MMLQKQQNSIADEAREWVTTLHSGETVARPAFEAWLSRSPEHKKAFRQAEQLWRDFDFVAISAGIDVPPAPKMSVWQKAQLWLEEQKKVVLVPAFVMATVLLVVFVTPQLNILSSPVIYETRLGEIRDVTLADGSVVTLGAKSKIETHFSGVSREVGLLEGEAFWDVSPDPERPFVVRVDDTAIRVLGTRFDVKQGTGRVYISVLDGAVEVAKAGERKEGQRRLMRAGDRLISDHAEALPAVEKNDGAEPGAWRSGRLAYDNALLSEIMADVSRYYDKEVLFASADIANIRLTTAFNAADIERIFTVLQMVQPIVADAGTEGQIILKHKDDVN